MLSSVVFLLSAVVLVPAFVRPDGLGGKLLALCGVERSVEESEASVHPGILADATADYNKMVTGFDEAGPLTRAAFMAKAYGVEHRALLKHWERCTTSPALLELKQCLSRLGFESIKSAYASYLRALAKHKERMEQLKQEGGRVWQKNFHWQKFLSKGIWQKRAEEYMAKLEQSDLPDVVKQIDAQRFEARRERKTLEMAEDWREEGADVSFREGASAASSDLVLSIIFAATLKPPICAAEIDVDSENLACITFSNWFKAESDMVSSVAKREITDAFKSTLR